MEDGGSQLGEVGAGDSPLEARISKRVDATLTVVDVDVANSIVV